MYSSCSSPFKIRKEAKSPEREINANATSQKPIPAIVQIPRITKERHIETSTIIGKIISITSKLI